MASGNTVRVRVEGLPEWALPRLREVGKLEGKPPDLWLVVDAQALQIILAGGDPQQRCQGCGE